MTTPIDVWISVAAGHFYAQMHRANDGSDRAQEELDYEFDSMQEFWGALNTRPPEDAAYYVRVMKRPAWQWKSLCEGASHAEATRLIRAYHLGVLMQ